LAHPDFDFWIDVRIHDFGGRWLAVADLSDQPEMGIGESMETALDGALAAFETHLRRELSNSARVAMDARTP
jgi:hypothetical protein